MIKIKDKIAEYIEKATNLKKEEIAEYIETPKELEKGDYAFPCFRLAKEMKKSPQTIAEEIKEKIEASTEIIEKIETVGAYVNFYINKEMLVKEVISETAKEDQYGKATIGEGKNVIIEY